MATNDGTAGERYTDTRQPGGTPHDLRHVPRGWLQIERIAGQCPDADRRGVSSGAFGSIRGERMAALLAHAR